MFQRRRLSTRQRAGAVPNPKAQPVPRTRVLQLGSLVREEFPRDGADQADDWCEHLQHFQPPELPEPEQLMDGPRLFVIGFLRQYHGTGSTADRALRLVLQRS